MFLLPFHWMFGARHEKKAVAVGDSGDVTSGNIGDSLGAPRDKQDQCCLAAAWMEAANKGHTHMAKEQNLARSYNIGPCGMSLHPREASGVVSLAQEEGDRGPRPLAFIFSRAPSTNLR